jgi:putative FmdB family regulatory protein
MPLYDYDCAACGRRIEVVHGVFAPGPTHCPNCGSGPLRKAITAAAVHYKGSGWAKKERRASTASTGAKTASETAAAESDAKDAGATTSATKADSGSDGDTPAKDRPATPSKAAGTSTATKTD